MLLTPDRNDGLIEVTSVPEPAGRPATDLTSKRTAELLRPKPAGLVRDNDLTSRQQILDHPRAEKEPGIQPRGASNDFSRKAMTSK